MAIFEISAEIRNVVRDAYDEIIAEFGKTIKIVYPGIPEICVNCTQINIGGKPTFIYKHGGPVPFNRGFPCPLCNNSSVYRIKESSEEISAVIDWNPRDFKLTKDGFQVPHGIIGIKCRIEKWGLLRKADYIIAPVNTQAYEEARYNLFRAPIDLYNIVSARYCLSYWQRVG